MTEIRQHRRYRWLPSVCVIVGKKVWLWNITSDQLSAIVARIPVRFPR